MPKLKLTIEAINARLKAAKVGVSVLPRGDRLYLQATLPPKPRKKKTQPYQQQVSLKIYASQDGLAQAEAKALELGELIAREKFDWKTYEGNTRVGGGCYSLQGIFPNQVAERGGEYIDTSIHRISCSELREQSGSGLPRNRSSGAPNKQSNHSASRSVAAQSVLKREL
jgi:hypothetical protein